MSLNEFQRFSYLGAGAQNPLKSPKARTHLLQRSHMMLQNRIQEPSTHALKFHDTTKNREGCAEIVCKEPKTSKEPLNVPPCSVRDAVPFAVHTLTKIYLKYPPDHT